MKKFLTSEKAKNIIFNLVVIICIVLFAISIAPKTLQNDTFYNIKVGEYIATHGISNLTEDTFSWHKLPYTYPHWLYDLGIYMVYFFFGHPRNLYFNNNINIYARRNNLFI